jgi:hypothetical protein
MLLDTWRINQDKKERATHTEKEERGSKPY